MLKIPWYLLTEVIKSRAREFGSYLCVLILEPIQKTLQQFISVVNSLGVLSDDPDHGGSETNS